MKFQPCREDHGGCQCKPAAVPLGKCLTTPVLGEYHALWKGIMRTQTQIYEGYSPDATKVWGRVRPYLTRTWRRNTPFFLLGHLAGVHIKVGVACWAEAGLEFPEIPTGSLPQTPEPKSSEKKEGERTSWQEILSTFKRTNPIWSRWPHAVQRRLVFVRCLGRRFVLQLNLTIKSAGGPCLACCSGWEKDPVKISYLRPSFHLSPA